MTYNVFDASGAELAHEVDGDTAASLVAQAAPGATVRRGLVQLYCNTERKPVTAKRLQFRARVASYPHPCSIYGVVSWREGMRFGRLLRLCIHWTILFLILLDYRPKGVAKGVLPRVCMLLTLHGWIGSPRSIDWQSGLPNTRTLQCIVSRPTIRALHSTPPHARQWLAC